MRTRLPVPFAPRPRWCSRTAPGGRRTSRRTSRCRRSPGRIRGSRARRRVRRGARAPAPRSPTALQRAPRPHGGLVESSPSMRISAPTETAPGETRVALVPRSATQLVSTGATVAIQAGAGMPAGITDAAYREVSAEVIPDPAALLADADIVVVVRRPDTAFVAQLKRGSILVGVLEPAGDPALVRALVDGGITAFRLEAMPRISRAQDMDVLSSMATLAGYHAAVMAAFRLPRIFPLMMTAAGTITPARALILGAGVAGLQAIATCRRLGAVVEAFDVRPAVRDQVESLGARFVETGVESETQQDTGGYARELEADAQARQQQVLAEHVKESDVVITTAQIPNRKAPVLVTADMVASMRTGSVIVDLAAPGGEI